MALTFGTSVAVNNILALRAFYTFIFNYELHEAPAFWEKWWLPALKRWVARRALQTMLNLINDGDAQAASVSLNDVAGDFFSVLYIVQYPDTIRNVHNGHDLFQVLADMTLQFEKIRKPNVAETEYEQPKAE